MYEIHPQLLGVLCVATRRICAHLTRCPPTVLAPPLFPSPTHPHLPSHRVQTVIQLQASGYALSAETSAAGGTAAPMLTHTTSARRTCMLWSSRPSECGTTPATATYTGSSKTEPTASSSSCPPRQCAPSTTAARGAPARRTPSPQRKSRRSGSNTPIC